jgi:hypothetical protein
MRQEVTRRDKTRNERRGEENKRIKQVSVGKFNHFVGTKSKETHLNNLDR